MNSNQQSDIFKAWSFESEEPYIIVLFFIMWSFSFLPSISGYPLIIITDIGLIIFLLADAIVTLISNPSTSNEIWNLNNWFYYSLRRWAV